MKRESKFAHICSRTLTDPWLQSPMPGCCVTVIGYDPLTNCMLPWSSFFTLARVIGLGMNLRYLSRHHLDLRDLVCGWLQISERRASRSSNSGPHSALMRRMRPTEPPSRQFPPESPHHWL